MVSGTYLQVRVVLEEQIARLRKLQEEEMLNVTEDVDVSLAICELLKVYCEYNLGGE